MLKILQIITDWKWTGPAEPTLNLSLALKEYGFDVFFACSKCPSHIEPAGFLGDRAKKAGLTPLKGLCLKKSKDIFRKRDLGSLIRDANFLRRFVRNNKIDIIHANTTHDHLLAGFSTASIVSRPAIARTNHKARSLPLNMANRVLMRRFTDGFLTYSQKAFEQDQKNFSDCNVKMAKINPVVDLERFRPAKCHEETRRELGIEPGDIVTGIVARVQRHRKFDILLKAALLATKEMDSLKFLVVGRGTHINDVAIKPAEKMGLAKKVIFAGYRKHDFHRVINCFDMKVFLVPGSDGSCRAVRELMAIGKPVIATKRGMLPELVEDGQTGLLIDESPKQLATAILRLAKDEQLRAKMGISARERAELRFDRKKQLREVTEFYTSLTP